MFACLFLPPVPLSSAARQSPAAAAALAEVAREFSPRVEARECLVTLDVGGLDRLLGDAWAIGRELRRVAADRGLAVHVAVAATRSAAMLLACGRSGLTVARPGEERRLLADLPLSVLEKLADIHGPSGGSCPGGSHPSLQPGRSLDPVARLDARATGPGCRTRASALEKPCDAGLASREAVGVQDGRVPPSPTADRRPTPQASIPCRLSPSIARAATFPARSRTGNREPGTEKCDPLTPNSQLLIPDTDHQVPSTKYQVPRPCLSSLSTTHYPLSTVLRRFRIPIPARVQIEDGAPVRVVTERAGLAGGRVERAAGPWRTSGEWWQLSDARLQPRADGRPVQVGWNRDEWDVALGDGGIYRVYRDRDRNRWFVDGIVD